MKLPIVYKLLTKTLCFNTVMTKSFMFAFRMPHKFKITPVSSCSNSVINIKKNQTVTCRDVKCLCLIYHIVVF